MARSQIQIEESLIQSIQTNDPGMDAQKGPLRGAFVQPQAKELAALEQVADDLSLRYSLQYVTSENPGILNLYAFNHGLRQGDGSPAPAQVVMYAHTLPPTGTNIFIPQGTTITTQDRTVAFQTIQDVVVSRSEMAALFNVDRRRYEITVNATSVGIGPEYELSAGRLRFLGSTIEYIDGVAQLVATGDSSPRETTTALGQRQQAKFVGLALGSAAGVESTVRDFAPAAIKDVSLVYSTELSLFRRPTRRPAYDVYIVGQDFQTQTDTFVAQAGDTEFLLTKQPVASIGNVLVNGVTVTGVLIKDNLPASSASSASTDKLGLSAPATAGDEVVVSYTYDQLTVDTQTYIDQANQGLWESDILIRQANAVPLDIEIEIEVLASFDSSRIQRLALQAVFGNINLQRLGLVYSPTATKQAINQTVAGLSNISVTKYQRQDAGGIIPVDTIETLKTEYAVTTTDSVLITVRT